MTKNPSWFYNEYDLSGTDFHSEKEARNYRDRILKIRDTAGEAKTIAETIGLTIEHELLDIGAGPGLITVELAKYCRQTTAADISEMMIGLGKDYAREKGVTNIDFIKSGFLEIDSSSRQYDVVITQRAFHHIPDFWKQVALLKINKVLRPGGVFYLDDVIYSFQPADFTQNIEEWFESVKKLFGENNLYTAVNHVAKEYSCFTWMMEGMIERAGFTIEKAIRKDNFFMNYVSRKSGVV
ncbi:MAG: hypothetical protein A2Y33_10000 [Spirochaetes bacterium GWF1_51_8]|nr:MAG: hypothetical protein A2Y33_10000 [Spirochaetes bacterium GWF1_51_8]